MNEISKKKMIFSQLMALAFDAGAIFGVFLVLYGVVSVIYKQPCLLFDELIKWTSPIVTLIGAAAVVVSIYFPSNPTPPKSLSKYFTAPVMLLMILFTFIAMVLERTSIPDSILFGFSITALFGCLIRLFPRLHEKYDDPRY